MRSNWRIWHGQKPMKTLMPWQEAWKRPWKRRHYINYTKFPFHRATSHGDLSALGPEPLCPPSPPEQSLLASMELACSTADQAHHWCMIESSIWSVVGICRKYGRFFGQIWDLWVCPLYGRKKTTVFVAAVVEPSWQVPSSHNFRLMDPLGYAAGEAQFVDGRQGWLDRLCQCARHRLWKLL